MTKRNELDHTILGDICRYIPFRGEAGQNWLILFGKMK